LRVAVYVVNLQFGEQRGIKGLQELNIHFERAFRRLKKCSPTDYKNNFFPEKVAGKEK